MRSILPNMIHTTLDIYVCILCAYTYALNRSLKLASSTESSRQLSRMVWLENHQHSSCCFPKFLQMFASSHEAHSWMKSEDTSHQRAHVLLWRGPRVSRPVTQRFIKVALERTLSLLSKKSRRCLPVRAGERWWAVADAWRAGQRGELGCHEKWSYVRPMGQVLPASITCVCQPKAPRRSWAAVRRRPAPVNGGFPLPAPPKSPHVEWEQAWPPPQPREPSPPPKPLCVSLVELWWMPLFSGTWFH